MAILKPDKVTTMCGLKVNEYLLTKHCSNIAMPSGSMAGNRIGVTIHNTEWISTASGTTPAEQYTRATANGNMNDVRVHYYVDHACAWQNLPLTLPGWHAADGGGDGNMRTIAIECIMSSSYNSTDQKSEDNAARLAAALLHELDFDITHLYTHNHWYGRKYCPAYILPHWNAFRDKVQKYLNELNKATAPKEEPAKNEIPLNAGDSEFKVGDAVYVVAGAVDANGRKASAIYAGANNALTIKSMSNDICTLVKGDIAVYRMGKKYLTKQPPEAQDKLIAEVSKVQLAGNAVWWGTNTPPPAWVFKQTYYLQQWNTTTGRAVIGTTPRSTSTTTTGAVDIKYLKKA